MGDNDGWSVSLVSPVGGANATETLFANRQLQPEQEVRARADWWKVSRTLPWLERT